MFSPRDDSLMWTIAKTIFSSADGDYQAGIAHLAHTHFVAGTFIAATRRHLSQVHPLRILLRPHSEGTALINYLADKTLINTGGAVDRMTNPDINDFTTVAGQQALDRLSRDFSFPALVAERGVDEKGFPAPYPYRDDGMLVWNAIQDWVNNYLRIYYKSNDDIKNDYELQGWVKELSDDQSQGGGCVAWLKKFDNTIEMLVRVVSSVIFVGSASHAAVNFPLQELQCYTPAFPLALYQPPPQSVGQRVNYTYYMDMLPPVQMASMSKNVAYLLGDLQYTTLGQYPDNHFGRDKRVAAELAKFQTALRDAEARINRRNDAREARWRNVQMPPGMKPSHARYEYLRPSKIPQSVNI